MSKKLKEWLINHLKKPSTTHLLLSLDLDPPKEGFLQKRVSLLTTVRAEGVKMIQIGITFWFFTDPKEGILCLYCLGK